jgi:hypothetical protein
LDARNSPRSDRGFRRPGERLRWLDPSAKLLELKNDPVGRYEPPGARLIDSREQNEGSTLGKPVYPEYRRLFELPPGDRERQIQHAADAAAAAGWAVTADAPSRTTSGAPVHLADKELAAGRADLAITLFPNGPPSGETHQAAMLIRMRLL